MKRLEGAHELLDGPLGDPGALEDNLRDLRRINRLLGGVDLSARAVASLAGGRENLTLLDVGTGAADIPVALLARARGDGRQLSITATDGRAEVVRAARAVDPGLDRTPGLKLAVADGLALPYPDASFDVAHISLVLHHHDPAEAVTLLRELRRVARSGVVVNDLSRGRLRWLGAVLLTATITSGRYTRHDAPLSVRRAYTLDEVRSLFRDAGIRPVTTVVGLFGHRYAVAGR